MLQSYWQAVVLGVVQGLTEFLPVSSSGHLALVQRALSLDAAAPSMLLFDVLTHVATLLAVVVVFRASIVRFARRLLLDVQGVLSSTVSPRRAPAVRITLLGVTASLPTAAIGLRFQHQLEAAFDRPSAIAIALSVTGTVLLLTGAMSRRRRSLGWRRFPFWAAFGVGVAQGVAILPGISRSGATIGAAMLLGLRRRWAAEFSFFIAAPAILGATLLKIRDVAESSGDASVSFSWGPIAVGATAAFLVGLIALRLLLKAVQRMKLAGFAVYCYLLAALVFALVRTGDL